MKQIKKLVAVVLLSLTIFNSIFTSYSMTVQAAEVIPAMTALEALLSLFGLELGLGEQTDFFSNPEFEDFVTAVANGETVSMPSYGDVNFSDGESILSFMAWASALTYSVADGNVLNAAKVLDSTSYKNSGTSATNAMEQQISSLSGKYSSSENLAEDIQDTFSVVGGSSDDAVMTSSRWDIFTGMLSAFMLGTAERIKELAGNFTTPEETEYQEYISAFDDGFDPARAYAYYCDINDPQYSESTSIYIVGHCLTRSSSSYEYVYAPLLVASFYFDDYFIYSIQEDSGLVCYQRKYSSYYSSTRIAPSTRYYQPEVDSYIYPKGDILSYSELVDLYLPLFDSQDAALAYLESGDTSGLLNLVDDSAYPNFRKVASTASATLSIPLTKWLDTGVAVDTIPDVAAKVLDASRSAVGKLDYVATVDTAIQEATGVKVDTETGTETETSTNYFGILGKILAAILALPAEAFKLFLDPVSAISETLRALATWQDGFLTWIKTAYADAMAKVDAIATTANPNGSIEDDDSGSSDGTLNILNGLLLLIGLFFILLRIFLHLLEFIINIFKIPADPGFITDDFAIGFEYIKSVQLSPLNISVYDFLMGLVHILVLFSVVKVLKKHIDKIHI